MTQLISMPNQLALFDTADPPYATPELWNDKWTQIQANFTAISDGLLVATDTQADDGDAGKLIDAAQLKAYMHRHIRLADDQSADQGDAGYFIDAAQLVAYIGRHKSDATGDNDTSHLATSAAVYALTQLISANSQAINAINSLLQSDNADLDTLQEVVDFIELVKSTQDTLAISNIAGLSSALSGKASLTHYHELDALGIEFGKVIVSGGQITNAYLPSGWSNATRTEAGVYEITCPSRALNAGDVVIANRNESLGYARGAQLTGTSYKFETGINSASNQTAVRKDASFAFMVMRR